jgi:hypothetical protein
MTILSLVDLGLGTKNAGAAHAVVLMVSINSAIVNSFT